MTDIINSSSTRFDIDNMGWRRLNAGRSAAHLIREAVSNALDASGVTEINVKLEPGFVSIEDDSPVGCEDPRLIFTVFMTNKADDPSKRGRKGRGAAELISAAEWAEVDTKGFKTTFTEGRVTEVSDRTAGTKVSVKVAAWGQPDIDDAINYLNRIIVPPDIKMYINDRLVPQKKMRFFISSYLRTQIIVDGIQKDTTRYVDTAIFNLSKGETTGWLFEMGIPVQQIDTKFHLNVGQRIPLNDNRDTVDTWWLNGLYGDVLNHMLGNTGSTIGPAMLRQSWVERGMPYLSKENERKLIGKLYGNLDALAVRSDNSRVNDVAKQHGTTLVSLAGVSDALATIIKSVLPEATAVVATIENSRTDTPVNSDNVDGDGYLIAVVKYLSNKVFGWTVNTTFFRRETSVVSDKVLAHIDTKNHVIGFNVNAGLPLHNPLHPQILSIIAHEFAHYASPLHDAEFLREVESLAGRLAVIMLENAAEIQRVAGGLSTKRLAIYCCDCGAERYIKPQDIHQVKRCESCTKKARRERAKERKNGGT